jgi:hypothetical protein
VSKEDFLNLYQEYYRLRGINFNHILNDIKRLGIEYKPKLRCNGIQGCLVGIHLKSNSTLPLDMMDDYQSKYEDLKLENDNLKNENKKLKEKLALYEKEKMYDCDHNELNDNEKKLSAIHKILMSKSGFDSESESESESESIFTKSKNINKKKTVIIDSDSSDYEEEKKTIKKTIKKKNKKCELESEDSENESDTENYLKIGKNVMNTFKQLNSKKK